MNTPASVPERKGFIKHSRLRAGSCLSYFLQSEKIQEIRLKRDAQVASGEAASRELTCPWDNR